MNNIDNSINFIKINIGLVTISDSRDKKNDKSGNLLEERIINFGKVENVTLIGGGDLMLFAAREFLKNGFNVREIPVQMRERSAGQPSNRNFRLIYYFLRLLIVIFVGSRRKTKGKA